MKFFVVCPYCGQELLKAEDGSTIEISCPKCNKDLIIKLKDYQIMINESSSSQD